MMAQNDLSTAARPSIVAAGKRQKRQSEHLKRVAQMEPSAWQEKHDPTESVQVVLSHTTGMKIDDRGEHVVRVTRTVEQCRRRAVDARLWSSLDGDMQDAAIAIEAAHKCVIAGLGSKPASFERKSGGRNDLSERQGQAASDYNRWVEEVDTTLRLDPRDELPMRFGVGKAKDRWTMERLIPEAAIAILCHGMNCEEVDAERGKRKGWASENLKQSLTVWLYRTNRRRRPMLHLEDTSVGLTMKQLLVRQRNRRVDRIADAIIEKQRVVRKHAA